MKGRSNYLCLHRFDALREGNGPIAGSFGRSTPALGGFTRTADEAHYMQVIDEWRRETSTGDRAEIENLPEDLPFWNDIAASAENCLGSECPQYQDCFVTRMRQRAAASDIVIVNHHLLCADAAVRQSDFGEVIPSCNYAVVDEAHQLEDVATQYFGIVLGNYRCEDLVRDVERALGAGLIGDPDRADAIRRDADWVRGHARAFFDGLQMIRFDGASGMGAESRIRIRAGHLDAVADSGAALSGALDALEADLALARDVPEDVLALGRRASVLRDELVFLMRADDPTYVYYLEIRGRGTYLRAAPIDVSAIVRELVIDRMRATVLTSATLTVDGSFEYVSGRLGIRGAGELRLASEFDYTRQSILYLPKNMPEPKGPQFAAAAARQVVQILQRSRGRAFVLFTSYAVLRRVHELIADETDYPILVQGTAPRSALLRDFKATPHAVLLATSSFWQGVDVVGDALSCVIIDKLPFASPGDPVTAARIEAIAQRGGSPFGEYQVPLAILALQQGLGRLIRHRQDRGVLAILDPRLRTMAYGRRFLASLPPAPVTHDLDDVERFFG
jgi:ATP-dependent DNA helicase DinG